LRGGVLTHPLFLLRDLIMTLSKSMPLLYSQNGVWEGYYRYYNSFGEKIDQHKSRLLCRVIGDQEYHQTNIYRWEDGKKELRDFPAEIKDNKLIFSGTIDGWAASVDLDEFDRTMLLYWKRINEPDLYIYEMIQLSDDRKHRSRTWQWFNNGKLLKRTLIDELKISDDWQSFENQDPEYSEIAKNLS